MADEPIYNDRVDAGEQLAQSLRGVDADRVAAIPRGALPVARPVADALDRPLDVVVGRKISHPENDDFAVGAVTVDGVAWLDDDAIEEFDVDDEYLAAAVERERESAREKIRRYAGGSLPDVAGETVVVVDDGAATGATARVCVRLLYERDAARVVVALPVASPKAVDALAAEADDVVCPSVPEDFFGVWEYYAAFDQVHDDEAVTYLD